MVYAPTASFTASGGGTETIDFVGAGIFNSVTMSGNYRFHYDEDLSNLGSTDNGMYRVTSWDEI